jgi:hypothetical protein
LFSYVDLEARVRRDHPLRAIRTIVNEALAALEREHAACPEAIFIRLAADSSVRVMEPICCIAVDQHHRAPSRPLSVTESFALPPD